jgi:dihydroxy-acid dehydratase
VLYYGNEDEANNGLLDVHLLDKLRDNRSFSYENMLAMAKLNAPDHYADWQAADYDTLFDRMVEEGALKIALIVAGQGPVAFGMPEMFTPMQHINANRKLKRLVTLISDGRYSGVTYGAAIGHMTPEAIEGGGILYLQTGDMLYMNLRERQIQFLDDSELRKGALSFRFDHIPAQRQQLSEVRLAVIRQRQRTVAASNRMLGHTDASEGVVPLAVYAEAELDYKTDILQKEDVTLGKNS